MKRAAAAAVAAALIFAACPAGLAAQVRVLWTLAGPSNPGYEWVTLAAAENGLAFAVKPGPPWDFTTENGRFTETGSTIAALDLATGRPVWTAESRWPILSPLLLTSGRHKLRLLERLGVHGCSVGSGPRYTGRCVWRELRLRGQQLRLGGR